MINNKDEFMTRSGNSNKQNTKISQTIPKNRFVISYLENYYSKSNINNNRTKQDNKLETSNVYKSDEKAALHLKHGETIATKKTNGNLPTKFITINPSSLKKLKKETINDKVQNVDNKKLSRKSSSNLNLNQPSINQDYINLKSKQFTNVYSSHQQVSQQPQPKSPPPPVPAQNYNYNATYSQFSYMEMMRMYQKQKFLEEYLKNNGDAATQIIPKFLHLGGHNSIIDPEALSKQGITHVLNMAQELTLNPQEYSERNIKLFQIGAKDTREYNIRADFDHAFMFIDDCLRSRGQIIVNCARGISRSATIVLGYLMFRYNLKLTDAYKLVVGLRPQVRPNLSFRHILIVYEQELNYIKTHKFKELNMKQDMTNYMPINSPLFYPNRTNAIYSRS